MNRGEKKLARPHALKILYRIRCIGRRKQQTSMAKKKVS